MHGHLYHTSDRIVQNKRDLCRQVSKVRRWIRRDKTAHGPTAKPDPPAPFILRENLPPELRHPIEAATPFRAILLPPRSIPAPQLRLPAKISRDERRRQRAHRALSVKVRFAGPDADYCPPAPSDSYPQPRR
jgi:hypothetical protein